MTKAYYNEIDKKAALWLQALMDDGLIAEGDIDTRSITEVTPDDVKGYTQCHFFAGIGVWSAALRHAGWPDSRPVWTGSCPCQDWSVAGKCEGKSGDRDLWPHFASLIRERNPECVFGEQVEAAIGYGWLDRLRVNMEAEAYAVGSCVLGAHSAGAPHIRQRLYWVVDSQRSGRVGSAVSDREPTEARRAEAPNDDRVTGEGCAPASSRLADSQGRLRGRLRDEGEKKRSQSCYVLSGELCGVRGNGLADCQQPRLEGHPRDEAGIDGQGRDPAEADLPVAKGCLPDLWHESCWFRCRDGKVRRVPTERRLFPLVDDGQKSYRMAGLRGAGNAICLGTAAMFIAAYMEVKT